MNLLLAPIYSHDIMEAPPPAPDDATGPALSPVVLSYVNAAVEFIDDLVSDDEHDELVEQLNLHGNDVHIMDGLEAFTGLVELCLSSNCIEEIAFHALQPLVHLRVLDLSANSIQSTLGFPQLPQLEELSMAHNCLQCLEGLSRPVKFPKLRYMDLRGNMIAGFNDVISLQRLKRLSHLRLQAADGSQANPICDLDDYQHVIIKMLPKLELLDEEEVEFLKEMGSLHMPKYRSLMRRIVENKRTERHSARSPYGRQHLPSPGRFSAPEQTHRLPNTEVTMGRALARPSPVEVSTESRHRTDCVKAPPGDIQDSQNDFTTVEMPPPAPPSIPDVDVAKHVPQRIVVKDCCTNTEAEPEKDAQRLEQLMTRRENEFLEKEKVFLSRENEFFVREKAMQAQMDDLTTQLKDAQSRATKAEATVLEMSNHLLQKEKDQAATVAASDESVSAIQQSQNAREDEWNATVAALKTSHEQELTRLTVDKQELESKLAALEADAAGISRRLREADESLKQKCIALEKMTTKAEETTRELELARKKHEAIVDQVSNELSYNKGRLEQTDKRSTQLEQQIVDLKANIEAVYNKCVEKDETVQQLKKSLAARQDELDMLRMQHAKDSERQDRLQEQQQVLYERQLQASVIQVEMEFRKEHQQSLQKIQVLQRKQQERVKEMKRIREAYQTSLQREASAKMEIEKLQAILAEDKKKLLVDDTKRSDLMKAELQDERNKRHELQVLLADEQKKNGQVAELLAEIDEAKQKHAQLAEDIRALDGEREAWKKLEGDLRAALKVKDVMLADQLRQIKELEDERRQSDEQFNDEVNDLQAQIEDLENALDENLQKCAEEEVKTEALTTKLAALESEAVEKDNELGAIRAELEQKVAALEFIDQEMQRMRGVLENQDALFQKRLQKHLEQQREEIERVRVGAEEEREHQLLEWETERGEMMRKYERLATEMKDIATQNTELRAAVDQERRRNAQNDRDMRIMLAQIDRERQAKKENLRQIKSLFEQLQRES